MRITKQIEAFIRNKVEAKVAPILGEQEYNNTVNMCEQWANDITKKLNDVVELEFYALIDAHPELEGAELTNPLEHYHKLHVRYSTAVFSKEMQEKRKLREDYVDEVCQRVCIDAAQCKDTTEILQLIDRLVK